MKEEKDNKTNIAEKTNAEKKTDIVEKTNVEKKTDIVDVESIVTNIVEEEESTKDTTLHDTPKDTQDSIHDTPKDTKDSSVSPDSQDAAIPKDTDKDTTKDKPHDKLSIEDESKNQKEDKLCWICYEKDNTKELISACKCKGSLQYAHSDCISNWLTESKGVRCPQCKFTYKQSIEYESICYRIMDNKYVPICVSIFLIGLSYILFHYGLTKIKSKFKILNSSSSTLYGYRFTNIITEIEIYALLLTVLYICSHWIVDKCNITFSFLNIIEEEQRRRIPTDPSIPESLQSYDVILLFYNSLHSAFCILQKKKIKKKRIFEHIN